MKLESITKLFKHFDAFLMACLLFALLAGLLVLYSASGGSFTPVYKQMINISIAFLFNVGRDKYFAIRPSKTRFTPLFLGVILLLGVEFLEAQVMARSAGLILGFIKIQPSEIMRIAMPMMVASYLSKQDGQLTARHFLIGGLILVLPVALIMMQPDLGTSLLITASGFFVLFLAGLSLRFLFGSSILLIAISPFLWSMLHDYQRTRIETLIDPTTDPLGAGYHTIQAMIAIGSGGFSGKGWLNGTQTQLEFLPERTTDFIFAVFAEEFGLLGNMLLLVMFLLIIFRGLIIASQAASGFSRLLAGSVTLTFFTYAFVNIGMVSGILPIVGVPLPLVSYGGTSMVTLCLSFGILMSIQSDKKLVAR